MKIEDIKNPEFLKDLSYKELDLLANDIRKYIIENFKDDNAEKIRDSIETTISSRDEDALIGLGVLFELLLHRRLRLYLLYLLPEL